MNEKPYRLSSLSRVAPLYTIHTSLAMVEGAPPQAVVRVAGQAGAVPGQKRDAE